MNKSIYLDSTIPSYIFDDRESIKPYIDITRQWWEEERNNFSLWISEESIAELNRGNYPNKDKIIACILKLPMLAPNEHIATIAKVYITNYLIPCSLTGDAIHLAYASYYKIDFLLTWNCNHLANANKKQHIRIINTKMNLFTPDIITPFELFTETNYDK